MINFLIDLNKIPSTFGIYLWKDKNKQILYVGKANNIKKRITQYLNGSLNSFKTENMISNASFLDYIVCSNEKEALLLEQEMIKKHRPYYNILLLDDKKYPFICVELKSNKLEFKTRFTFKENKNTFSFGPIPTGFGSKVLKNFLIRECTFKNGLPIKNKSNSFWHERFLYAKKILFSSNQEIIKKLKRQMEEASNNEQYEIAAELRDTLNYLNKSNELKQVINFNNNETFDVIDFLVKDEYLLTIIHHFVNGVFYLQEEYENEIKINVENTILQFLNQFYSFRNKVNKIVTNFDINSSNIIFKTKIIKPQKGKYLQALKNAHNNNVLNQEERIYNYQFYEQQNQVVKSFLESLTKNIINDFIMIDNSNNNNENITSGIIYYKKYQPYYSNYRKYSINTKLIKRLSDVEYMKISSEKYFSNFQNEIPDLLIVDGGKQQLNEVKKVLKKLDIKIALIGLIKDNNHKTRYLINSEGKKIDLLTNKIVYNFFSKVQIEVDRYAKNFHRKKSLQKSLEGFLQSINGIGPHTEEKLLSYFKTYSNIVNATKEELTKIVSHSIAKKIIEKIKKME